MHFASTTLFLALVVGQPSRECYATNNFIVYAADYETAKQVCDAAEKRRRELAKLWLGDTDAADWAHPCRIDVAVAPRPGGVTEISYRDGKVWLHCVSVQGPLPVILRGPLPHELTHVFFAHQFGFQPPRWADEGGATLCEEAPQQAAHVRKFRDILDRKRQFALRDLLGMMEYPDDVPCFYAQSHALASFLVAAKGRKEFLAFVRDGSIGGWNEAVRTRYGYASIEHLERAWHDSLSESATKMETTP
jgi:hypothetical protein